MNSETAILIGVGLAVLIVAAIYGVASGTFSAAEDAIIGDDGGLLGDAKDMPEGGESSGTGFVPLVSTLEVVRWAT